MKLKIEAMPRDIVEAMENLPKPPSPEACMDYIRKRETETDYEPLGTEWEAEVMKNRKSDIVAMLREACRERVAANGVARKYLQAFWDRAVTPERLWEAMPRDVQRKISCHDLKRICDNLNSPNDKADPLHGRGKTQPEK